MDDFEEGFSDTLIDDRSPARDLGGEIAGTLADTGSSTEEQIDALVEALLLITDGDLSLLDRAIDRLT